jgi:hypothetical protein
MSARARKPEVAVLYLRMFFPNQRHTNRIDGHLVIWSFLQSAALALMMTDHTRLREMLFIQRVLLRDLTNR